MTDVQPDSKAAIDFLLRVYPDGPWLLTAIQTDRKAISTETFGPSSVPALEAWLKDYNGVRNIYWSVNPPIQAMRKKAEREEIKAVHYLHVDVDPRAGEDLDAEIERIKALKPSGLPEPTIVIYSGGGCQFFFKLQEPIPIDGDLAKAEDAKRYNQQLEVLYGGDNCHDISRIMRLPGTVNVPDAKKLKKGRKPALASVLVFNDNEYPVERFPKAPEMQIKGDKGLAGGTSPQQPKVEVSGNIDRLSGLDDLDQWNVPDRLKVVIAQGHHPDEPKFGDNSRSVWLFDAVCNLMRLGVPDQVIYSIITDRQFGISSSVVELGTSAQHRYAMKQLVTAKEWIIDPKLMRFNERFAVIGNYGGKVRVIQEVSDPVLRRTRLTKQTFDDFANRFCNEMVEVGKSPDGKPVLKPAGRWWLQHPNRRTYESIVFAPETETPGDYNLWRGFAVEQKPGDCSKFLHHTKENVCQGNEDHYAYLLGWMARAVQQPASPGYVALVLRGGKGTGKSFFAKQFGSLFGRHFLQVSNPGHLVGNFNSHLRDVSVLFADEAFYAGDKRHESVLKMIVTEETIPIEAKGVDLENSPNFVHLIMASNDDHVVPASGRERRFFVLDVGEGHIQDTSYFKAIAHEMDNGGREALLHFLRTYDISSFRVQDVPQTDALRDQKERSLGPEADWWLNKLRDGTLYPDKAEWPSAVRKEQLMMDYALYTKVWNTWKRGNMISFSKFLEGVCPGLGSEQRLATWEEPGHDGFPRSVTRRAYHWILPSLAECRTAWDKKFGTVKWPEPVSAAEQPRLSPEKPPF